MKVFFLEFHGLFHNFTPIAGLNLPSIRAESFHDELVALFLSYQIRRETRLHMHLKVHPMLQFFEMTNFYIF
jgi:hypothetical protein